MDRAKLVKLLNLSTSDNDAEALSALRHANLLIKREGFSWDEIVHPKKPKIPHKVRHNGDSGQTSNTGLRPETEYPPIDEMIEECLDEIENESGREFLESLYSFYEARGYLTQKQSAALKKFYDNLELNRGL